MIRTIYKDKEVWKGNGYSFSNNRYYFDDIGNSDYDLEKYFLEIFTEGLTKQQQV